MDATKKIKIERIEKDKNLTLEDEIVVENDFKIYSKEKLIASLMCTPSDLEDLTIGHLYSLGLIKNIDQLESLEFLGESVFVKFTDKKIKDRENKATRLSLDRNKIFDLSETFQFFSKTFQKTGGVHCAALIKDYKIIKFCEDVARNNAVDKLIGHIIKNKIDISDKYIFISCRVSDLIIDKILKIGFDLIISQSAPTSISVEMAKENKVNLIGFARGQRFNIYNQNENLIIR